MSEIKRFNFNQVAADLGYVAEPGAGGPGGKPGGLVALVVPAVSLPKPQFQRSRADPQECPAF